MKSISDPHGLTLFAQFEISGQRNDDGASEISAGVVRRSKVNRNLLSARRLWAGGGVFRSWFRTFRGWLTSPRRPVQPQTPAPDRAPSIPAQLLLRLYRVFTMEFDLKLHAEKLGPLPANFQAEMAAAQTAFGAARHDWRTRFGQEALAARARIRDASAAVTGRRASCRPSSFATSLPRRSSARAHTSSTRSPSCDGYVARLAPGYRTVPRVIPGRE